MISIFVLYSYSRLQVIWRITVNNAKYDLGIHFIKIKRLVNLESNLTEDALFLVILAVFLEL